MIKGKWIILAVLIIALVMGIATWPLLRIRRNHEIHKTETFMAQLASAIKDYQADHGKMPGTLTDLPPPHRHAHDAWGRPFHYRAPGLRHANGFDLWSLGPNEKDPADDIWN